MKRVTTIAAALALTVFTVLAGGVAAQQTNTSERTFLTFSNTVQMPGVTLPAGTYVFKLADTNSRNVVQVWNEQEDKMLGHWLFVQAERPEVTFENVVMFKETPAGTTPAVQFWYFPGERIGKEFVYPKDQAMQIAAATGQPVLTEDGSEVTSIDAQGNTTPWEKEQRAEASASIDSNDGVVQGSAESTQTADSTLSETPASAQPSAAAGSLAGNRGVEAEAQVQAEADAQPDADVIADVETRADASVQQSAEAQDRSQQPVGTSGDQAESQVARADELPRTASPLALSGLIGLLSLAGALGMRAYRQ